MFQAGGDERFLEESFLITLIVGAMGVDFFESDLAREALVPGDKDATHATLGDLIEHAVFVQSFIVSIGWIRRFLARWNTKFCKHFFEFRADEILVLEWEGGNVSVKINVLA